MNKAIIILSHGSRAKKSVEGLNSLTEKVKCKLNLDRVYPAFLQFSEHTLEDVVGRAIQNGASEIKVMPLFLFEGVHFQRDVVEKIRKLNEQYEQTSIILTKNIGDDEKLVDIIIDRIK
ncbi:MAG: cobalamin [Oscillospiraceae bacterium]|jgi:sirohydrochlorin ferrochelatase|nr:cobalamin [Oscillospiraceae bacterium]